MLRILLSALFLTLLSGSACQNLREKKVSMTNPLLCDPQTGVCEMPDTLAQGNVQVNASGPKPVKIVYFTDPICSSCWGIEPQLRRLKLAYGPVLDIEYHMGGLLPDWSYNSGGISKPSDVASHWDEVSLHYQMPIDGDVWLEDPLPSSYPPSIAFKAAQIQDKAKAIAFLRVLREMVFLEKKNITRWEYMASAAKQVGLDAEQLQRDYEGPAKNLFQQDLALAKQWGVRGFPSVFITNGAGQQVFVYGFRPYAQYEQGIHAIYPDVQKINYDTDWKYLFQHYPTLTTREFAELSNVTMPQATQKLTELVQQGQLKQFSTKNGPIWRR